MKSEPLPPHKKRTPAPNTSQAKTNKVSADVAKPNAAAPSLTAAIASQPPSVFPNENFSPLVEDFCRLAAQKRGDDLLAWQEARLHSLQGEVEEKLEKLTEARTRLEELEARQTARREKLAAGFIVIVSKMRPEAAAAQLSSMDEAAATHILTQLDPRVASAILNEIPPTKAARIADNMTGKSNATTRQ